jgi:hypothetical protein
VAAQKNTAASEAPEISSAFPAEVMLPSQKTRNLASKRMPLSSAAPEYMSVLFSAVIAAAWVLSRESLKLSAPFSEAVNLNAMTLAG